MNINQRLNQFADTVTSKVDTTNLTQHPEDKMSIWRTDLIEERAEKKLAEFENLIREAKEQLKQQEKNPPNSTGNAELKNNNTTNDNIGSSSTNNQQISSAQVQNDDANNPSRWRNEALSEDSNRKLETFENNTRQAREKLHNEEIANYGISINQMKPQVGSQNMGSRDIIGPGQKSHITSGDLLDMLKNELSEIKETFFASLEEAQEFIQNHSKPISEDLKSKIYSFFHYGDANDQKRE